MKAVVSRIRRLENQFRAASEPDFVRNARERLRIVVTGLDTSTCRRTLTASGSLTEVVELDGTREGLTDEQLEKFINSFPVERSPPHKQIYIVTAPGMKFEVLDWGGAIRYCRLP